MEYHDGGPLRNVADVPRMGDHRFGEKPALVLSGQETSYAELDRRIDRVATVLSDVGVEPGDRVGLYLPNTTQFPESYFGTIRVGAIPVPLNLRMDRETLCFVLEDADVDVLVSSPYLQGGFETELATIVDPAELVDSADVTTHLGPSGDADGAVAYQVAVADAPTDVEPVVRAYDNVAAQPYTSGTTGQPKGVPLTHRNLLTAVESLTKSTPRVDPSDTLLLVLPLFHIYGLNALLTTYLYCGATIVLQPAPGPKRTLQAIETHEVNHFPAVPAIYTMVYREYREDPGSYDIDSLEGLNSAAAPLPEDTRATISDEWDVVLSEGWGMTETAPAGTIRSVANAHKEGGCIGRPVYNLEVKLVAPDTRETVVPSAELDPLVGPPSEALEDAPDEERTGEIAVRGPQVFEGYYRLPEVTDAVFDDEDWFYTGDIARVDADGDLWMVDRVDDMFVVVGENVYPAEVEDALYDHPAVAEAAVVGVPHEVKGMAPVAFVVRESEVESSVVDADAIREFALRRVPTYAHPRRVFFVDELPRSATEKVQRYELESIAETRLDGPLEPSDTV